MEGDHKGLVIAYADLDAKFILDSVNFKVSKSGQDRVRSDRQKNVHAYVMGRYKNVSPSEYKLADSVSSQQVYYNPYLYESFVYVDSKECIGPDITQAIFADGKISVL
jgi:hypothetical protein